MIRIRKRSTVPSTLTKVGNADLILLKATYINNSTACQLPRNKLLKIKQAIYGDTLVKQALIDDQHEKCCYCESKFAATGYGDVEHFRPKGGVRQDRRGPLEKPGYYWLAYDWNNLFFSCEICNRRYKRNWFPLLNPTLRAKHHGQSLSRERPLLSDPGHTNPSRYLKFNKHVVTAKSVSNSVVRGKACIRAYGLDRKPLNRRREEFLDTLKLVRFAASLDLNNMTPADLQTVLTDLAMTLAQAHNYIALARSVWSEAAFDKSEYAGMIRDNFPQLPRR
ncbi:MAG TPA: hypothetical protein VF629_07005 [Hymenobacter sp.]|jgi:uncharacterized protein (TIGR02646 family)|uniref:hypothetical protein n=1 Tax=Hymenobacter sp. TaxID=1898978 RepID=UPI002EDA17A1